MTYPLLISYVMQQLLGMTDTAFLGRVGEVELGASEVASVYYSTLFMLGLGFAIGAQIVIGRRNGEAVASGKGFEAIGGVFWQSVWFLLGLAVVTIGMSYLLSPPLLKAILSSEAIFGAAVTYVQWRIPGLLFSFMVALFRGFYVGITRTRTLTLNSIILVSSNILLDWVLIFGHWGMPALGIQGAAMASTIAEGISLLFFIIWTICTADKKYALGRPERPIWSKLRTLLSTASWVMVENVLGVGIWLVFFLFIEHLGEKQLAIANIIRSTSGLPWVFTAAFGSCAATLISNIIGEGQPEGVYPLLRRINLMCFWILLPLLIVFSVFPQYIIGIFTDIPELVKDSVPTLLVMCGGTLITIPSFIYLQAVAGTGNTQPCLWIDLVCLGIYLIFCIVVIAILRCNVAICWLADAVYGVALWILSAHYLHRGKWQGKAV